MTTALLDLSVFIALAWPAHEHHVPARAWFLSRSRSKWATCPITQLGFIRLLSNPAFSPDALSVGEAFGLLMKNVSEPSHEFWPDALPVARALKPLMGKIIGHRQMTDAYLLSLAIRHKARLVTFDRGLVELATEAKAALHVELVSLR
ncbi:MAG: VapC toxin family PIN domain ribonuclease [Acidobacteria bacterium]|nr:MAG: VapC toxin family PIN domain ribonuclease [Acidobacteriota bacterium]